MALKKRKVKRKVRRNKRRVKRKRNRPPRLFKKGKKRYIKQKVKKRQRRVQIKSNLSNKQLLKVIINNFEKKRARKKGKKGKKGEKQPDVQNPSSSSSSSGIATDSSSSRSAAYSFGIAQQLLANILRDQMKLNKTDVERLTGQVRRLENQPASRQPLQLGYTPPSD